MRAPRVRGGLRVGPQMRDALQGVGRRRAEELVVEEGVPGARVLLHVVRDVVLGQRALELAGHAAHRHVLAAVARHDRARGLQHASRSPAAAARSSARRRRNPWSAATQREPAAHAEPDDADLAGAVARRPSSCCRAASMSANGRPVAGQHRPERRHDAAPHAAVAEQVGREGQEARRRPAGRPGGAPCRSARRSRGSRPRRATGRPRPARRGSRAGPVNRRRPHRARRPACGWSVTAFALGESGAGHHRPPPAR